MARPLRIEFPGAIHHVMARGNARQAIFLNDEDRDAYESGHRQLPQIGALRFALLDYSTVSRIARGVDRRAASRRKT